MHQDIPTIVKLSNDELPEFIQTPKIENVTRNETKIIQQDTSKSQSIEFCGFINLGKKLKFFFLKYVI